MREAAAVASPDERRATSSRRSSSSPTATSPATSWPTEIKQLRARRACRPTPTRAGSSSSTTCPRRSPARSAGSSCARRRSSGSKVDADELASLPDAALLLDARDRIVAANAQAEAMFGARLAGRGTYGLLTLSRAIDHARDDAGPLKCEGRRADDTPFTVEARVEVVGEHALVLLHEPGAAELRGEAQRYFDAAFDSAPIGMALFNTDGEYVRVNAALCTMLGRTEAELLGASRPGVHACRRPSGRRRRGLRHPRGRDEHAPVREAVRAPRRLGGVGHRQPHVPARLGGRPLSWVGAVPGHHLPARRGGGAARGARLSRARASGDGRRRRARARGTITVVNDALCRLTGFTREELVGSARPSRSSRPIARVAWPYARADRPGGGEAEMTSSRGRRAVPRGRDGLGASSARRDSSARHHDARHQRAQAPRGRARPRAMSDGLTGLLNRERVRRALRAEAARAVASGRPLSSRCSTSTTSRRQRPPRPSRSANRAVRPPPAAAAQPDGDHLARVGGEEFAWILPNTEAPAAARAAERACDAIRREPSPMRPR